MDLDLVFKMRTMPSTPCIDPLDAMSAVHLGTCVYVCIQDTKSAYVLQVCCRYRTHPDTQIEGPDNTYHATMVYIILVRARIKYMGSGIEGQRDIIIQAMLIRIPMY